MAIVSLFFRLFCVVFSGLSLAYLAVFILDDQFLLFMAPKDVVRRLLHINYRPDWNTVSLPLLSLAPSLNNTVLVSLFGLQHSIMLRGPIKKLLSLVLSESTQKSVYIFASGLCLCVIYFCWIPMMEVVWDVSNPLARLVIYGLMLFSACGVGFSLLNLHPEQLFSIAKKESRSPVGKLVTSGLYGLVRHPIYSFSLLLLWATPHLSVGHLLLATVFSVYVVCAVAMFEEPDLVREFGSDYAEYMKTTPRFVPGLAWLLRKQKTG